MTASFPAAVEMDITEEFEQWCRKRGLKAGTRTGERDFYELWEMFLESEYNDQRVNPQNY